MNRLTILATIIAIAAVVTIAATNFAPSANAILAGDNSNPVAHIANTK